MKNSLVNCAVLLLLLISTPVSSAIAQSVISQAAPINVKKQVEQAVLNKLATQNYPSPENIQFYETKIITNYGLLKWTNGDAGGGATAIKRNGVWEINIYGDDWGGIERLIKDGIPRTTAAKLLEPPAQVKSNNSALTTSISFAEGSGSLSVSEKNVNTVLRGGTLKRRDFHIAKMFEVTSYMCETGMASPGIDWTYYANSGKINLGDFRISCDLAKLVVEAYKVRAPEPTEISFSQEEDGAPIVKMFRVGTLDIERDPNKTKRWANFVAGFKPLRQ